MKTRHNLTPLGLLTALALVALLTGRAATAGDFQTNTVTSGGGNVVFSRTATDTNGNIYITGYYQNTFSYGGLAAPVLAANLTNFFLLKTDAAGNALWLTSSTTSSVPFVQGTAIAVDTAGNVFIGLQLTNGSSASAAITFTLGVTIGLPPISAISLVAKYSQSGGTFAWVKLDPTTTSLIRGLAVTPDNASIIAAGNFRGTGSFGGINLTALPSGADNMFLVKINASTGVTTWATDANCATGGYDEVTGVALDSSGNIYTTGTFGGVMFNGKVYQLSAYSTSLTNSSAFVVKWSNPSASAGMPQWELGTTDTSNSVTSANGLAVDVNSNVCVAFSLARTDPTSTNAMGLNISGTGAGGSTQYAQTNGGTSEGSIVKFDSNGNILWGEGTLGASGSVNANTRIAVTTNFVYSLGTFGPGAVTFGGTTTLGTPGDSFIMALTNATGGLGFVARVNGSGATPSLQPQDLIAATGTSGDTLDLVGTLAGSPATNSFVAQYAVGPFSYTINGGSNVTITGYSGPGGVVTIPASILGLPVTGIGVTAFQGNTTITSVLISNGVLNIADAAFYSCTALTSVFIPDSVTNLGNSAFAYCSALMSVTGGSNVMSMGQAAFDDCAALPGIILSTNLASVGSFTFFNCTALQSIVIPASLTQLGDYMFDGCTGLTNVVLTNTLTGIGNGAFGGCSSLTSLTIPNGVTSIGSAAFVACTALASVTIPGSVTNIGDTAFENCSSLTGVYFQGNAPSLGGANVFQGVNAAATVYYLAGAAGWGAPYYGGLPAVLLGGAYNQIASQVLGGGNVQLSFIGNYGINYALDRSASLSPANWVPQVTNSTGPGGLLVFTNTPDATTNNFWRFRSVP
jgi:hypothetical protein